MLALVIREAKPDDLAAVMVIEQTSFAPGLRETLPTYRARLDLFPLGFLVAEQAGRLLGFITAERWTETDGLAANRFAIDHHPALHHRADGEVLYFSALAVAADARGLGTGAALLTRLIADHTQAVQAALLVVARGWTAARHAYARAGFAEHSVLPGFFRAEGAMADDGLVLRRTVVPDNGAGFRTATGTKVPAEDPQPPYDRRPWISPLPCPPRPAPSA